jgi:hypothetical protein
MVVEQASQEQWPSQPVERLSREQSLLQLTLFAQGQQASYLPFQTM